jgi:hypothetical protein
MGEHHTEDKGDLGIAKAHADLVGKGFVVLFPATEHDEFDLVAYKKSSFHRIQVKYRATRLGGVSVQFRSVWADRHGTPMLPSDKAEVDVLCVYCPETDACYYVRPCDHRRSVTLRVTSAKNGQGRNVLQAETFRAFPHA